METAFYRTGCSPWNHSTPVFLQEPWEVKNGSGRPFQVFTPYWRKSRAGIYQGTSQVFPERPYLFPTAISRTEVSDELELSTRSRLAFKTIRTLGCFRKSCPQTYSTNCRCDHPVLRHGTKHSLGRRNIPIISLPRLGIGKSETNLPSRVSPRTMKVDIGVKTNTSSKLAGVNFPTNYSITFPIFRINPFGKNIPPFLGSMITSPFMPGSLEIPDIRWWMRE